MQKCSEINNLDSDLTKKSNVPCKYIQILALYIQHRRKMNEIFILQNKTLICILLCSGYIIRIIMSVEHIVFISSDERCLHYL